jgi:hypothetical protein
MPKPRHRGSKDGNHDKVVARFREFGCTVAELVDTGLEGWPDLVVGCIGLNHLVEVKNPDTRYGQAGLSPAQGVFARDWRGGPVYVVYTENDATTCVLAWRTAARPKR